MRYMLGREETATTTNLGVVEDDRGDPNLVEYFTRPRKFTPEQFNKHWSVMSPKQRWLYIFELLEEGRDEQAQSL